MGCGKGGSAVSWEIKQAVRQAVPLYLGLYGPTGSGKTKSAILLASGLAPTGKVVVIDTEYPRASLHADDKDIKAALPGGFQVVAFDPPYTPKRMIEAIDTCEKAGFEVCIPDSLSDTWNGPGGCEDIKEKTKGWATPKKENKRMMSRIKTSKMDIICCLKAHDKIKIVEGDINPNTGKPKQEYVSLGMQPEMEKNTLYPALVAFSIDQDTHVATMKKASVEALVPFFIEPHLLSKEDGVKLRQWNQTGSPQSDFEQLRARAKTEAMRGVEIYKGFFASLTKAERVWLAKNGHEDNKYTAEQADAAPL
jgi:hypothetical protein